MLREAEDDEHALQRDLDDRLAKESCSKEDSEWYQEVSAEESSKVKERVRNLNYWL